MNRIVDFEIEEALGMRMAEGRENWKWKHAFVARRLAALRVALFQMGSQRFGVPCGTIALKY